MGPQEINCDQRRLQSLAQCVVLPMTGCVPDSYDLLQKEYNVLFFEPAP